MNRSVCHHPHGWCGLKFNWVEAKGDDEAVTTHTGGVDWNPYCTNTSLATTSHHPHGWCGLKFFWHNNLQGHVVTTHTGGVDWNRFYSRSITTNRCHHPHGWCGLKLVMQMTKEQSQLSHHPHGWCGLKSTTLYEQIITKLSPPTRVVWIEIEMFEIFDGVDAVTTHTGGVDWNNYYGIECKLAQSSHHPHGWCGLKLFSCYRTHCHPRVTTHTGGVDWNRSSQGLILIDSGHHPHGWCGLKYIYNQVPLQACKVTTHTGGVDWNSLPLRLCKNGQVTTHTGGVDWN